MTTEMTDENKKTKTRAAFVLEFFFQDEGWKPYKVYEFKEDAECDAKHIMIGKVKVCAEKCKPVDDVFTVEDPLDYRISPYPVDEQGNILDYKDYRSWC